MLKPGINHCSNTEYHADNTFLSSSNLKTLLKDPEQFYREKILGIKPERKESDSFTEGSLTHSMILEPHLVNQEYAFYPGLRKAGAEFEAFKASVPPGKVIIARPMQIRVEAFKRAYTQCPPAVELLQGGVPEQTICIDYNGVPIKVRCDYINAEKGFIADVKTSRFPVDVDTFRETVKQWSYDLSAALYCMAAEQFYGKPFSFYFIAIGKTDNNCEVYKASDNTMEKGRLQVAKALNIYKECVKTGIWKLPDSMKVSSKEILEV